MKINAKWHKENRMPEYFKKYKGEKSADEIRGLWHKNHLKFCACRTDVPPNLRKYL
jgi:hypothetical protein